MSVPTPSFASGILTVGIDSAIVEPLQDSDPRLITAADAFCAEGRFELDQIGRWWIGVGDDGNLVIGGRVPADFPRLSQRAPGTSFDFTDLPPYSPEEAADVLATMNPFDPGTAESATFIERFWRYQAAAHQALSDELAKRPAWVAKRIRQLEVETRVLRAVISIALGAVILVVVWKTVAGLIQR